MVRRSLNCGRGKRTSSGEQLFDRNLRQQQYRDHSCPYARLWQALDTHRIRIQCAQELQTVTRGRVSLAAMFFIITVAAIENLVYLYTPNPIKKAEYVFF